MADLFEETTLRFDNREDWIKFVRILGAKINPRAVFLGDLHTAVRAVYGAKWKTEESGTVAVEMSFHRDAAEDLENACEAFQRLVVNA